MKSIDDIPVSTLKKLLPVRYKRYRRHPEHFLRTFFGELISISLEPVPEYLQEASLQLILTQIESGTWTITEEVMNIKAKRGHTKRGNKRKESMVT